MKKPVPQDLRDAAIAEWKAGGKADEIAKKLGVTSSALYLWARDKKKKSVVTAQPVNGVSGSPRDAIMLLRKAKHDAIKDLKSGKLSDLDSCHLLSMLALKSLLGD